MKWLLFKTGVKKSWTWLKHNWKVPLTIAWSVFIYILSRRNTDALKQVIESNKKAHREEVEIINRTHREEMMNLKNLQSRYKDTILKLEKQFEKEKKELSKKQIEEVKEIVIQSKGNPEIIKRKIENDFGIKFKN